MRLEKKIADLQPKRRKKIAARAKELVKNEKPPGTRIDLKHKEGAVIFHADGSFVIFAPHGPDEEPACEVAVSCVRVAIALTDKAVMDFIEQRIIEKQNEREKSA